MSYSERKKTQRERVEAAMSEPMPKRLYRVDLFTRAKNAMIGENVGQLGVRQIAQETKLSANIVQDALNGKATKIATLWKLAKYFGVDWLQLFDVDVRLSYEDREDPADVEARAAAQAQNGFVDLAPVEKTRVLVGIQPFGRPALCVRADRGGAILVHTNGDDFDRIEPGAVASKFGVEVIVLPNKAGK